MAKAKTSNATKPTLVRDYEFSKINGGINKRFKETRKKALLSQPQMAKLLGTSTSIIKQIDAGNIMPNIAIIRKWRKEFKVSYSWIIDGK